MCPRGQERSRGLYLWCTWSLSPWSKSCLVNSCTLRFVKSYLAVMDRLVLRSIRDPHPGPIPASSEATDIPSASTSVSANTSGAPAGCLNLLTSLRPNLNLFPKGKNSLCFCSGWFRTHIRTNQ